MAWDTPIVNRHLTIVLLLIAALSGPAAAQSPNIILIIGDDQAWFDYGFMGNTAVHTPHLDQLASQSLVLERGYVSSPLCRPSLATMLTGLSPSKHGIAGNDVDGYNRRADLDRPLRAEFHRIPSFVRSLSAAGYRTFQSGKWWEGSWQDGGFTDGMTHGDPEKGGRHGDVGLQIGRKTMKPLLSFIDRSVSEAKPFFVWYAPMLPHTPHNPPRRLLQKYNSSGLAEDVAAYYASCEWFDETCGTIFSQLQRNNIVENTVIIFLADNGWAASSTNASDPNQKQWKQYALRSKGSPFEAGIRTPLMISWPGKIAPEKNSDLAHAEDLYPTIAALAALPLPDHLTGINLLDAERRRQRQTITGVTHSIHNMTPGDPDDTLQYRWLVHQEWKLIRRFHGIDTTQFLRVHEWDTEEVRLFDLANDPHEQHNLADQHAELVSRLTRMLPDPSSPPQNPDSASK